MTDAENVDGAILKILSGVQSGVEVSLSPGHYVLGSGQDDDIQLIDVSLAPSHLELRIGQSGIQIRAVAGSIKTANGIFLDVDSEWQEIEPLDILTAGTTRFALGPASAKWTSITDIDVNDESTQEPPEEEVLNFWQWLAIIWGGLSAHSLISIALAGAFVLVAGAGIWYWVAGSSPQSEARASVVERLERVHAALSSLPFENNINVTQEVDGAIYVTGYVNSQAERRAVINAVEATHAGAYLRIWVLESIRQEVRGLITAKGLELNFDVSDNGVVTLGGRFLNDQEAQEFIATVRDEIPGVSSVTSHLKTGTSLLAQANELADSSQIKPWVILRLEKGVIEATGAVPVEKIDAWSGFLQAYARRLAPDIGLRSFVQLQDLTMLPSQPSLTVPTSAIMIGAPRESDSDIVLDVGRILQGDFAPDDVLIDADRSAEHRTPQEKNEEHTQDSSENEHAAQPAAVQQTGNLQGILQTIAEEEQKNGTSTSRVPAAFQAGQAPEEEKEDDDDKNESSFEGPLIHSGAQAIQAQKPVSNTRPSLTDSTRLLLQQWRDGRLQKTDNATLLLSALERLSAIQQGHPNDDGPSTRLARQRLHDQYLPAPGMRSDASNDACWQGALMRPTDALTALFWLDILSVGQTLSLSSFDPRTQLLIMEAALNPRRTTQCIAKIYPELSTAEESIFLREINRNPSFIRFILRDLPPYTLDISGASPGSSRRFIQTRNGQKIQEGAAPGTASRLILVGELGAVMEIVNGFATAIYGRDLTWLVD